MQGRWKWQCSASRVRKIVSRCTGQLSSPRSYRIIRQRSWVVRPSNGSRVGMSLWAGGNQQRDLTADLMTDPERKSMLHYYLHVSNMA